MTKKEHEIADLRQRIEWLTEQFRLMRARQFGTSSEKTMQSPDQLSLFNEAEATADLTVPEPEIEQIAYARKKQKGKREADFSGLPTEPALYTTEWVEGGAQWDYGDAVDLGGKFVWSNAFTQSYYHSSSCTLSGRSDYSGRVAPGSYSYSRVANGYVWDNAYKYYNVEA